jgi:hypothetical protein
VGSNRHRLVRRGIAALVIAPHIDTSLTPKQLHQVEWSASLAGELEASRERPAGHH